MLFASSCKHGGVLGTGEVMYVSAPQANLRDHVAAVYNRVGSVKNGERVEVLEHQKRFVRVRTAGKLEGWVELRSLAPDETYKQFQQLSTENKQAPVQGHAVTRTDLNMHVTPGRESETLYQLAESSKVELIKRSTAARATPEEVAAHRATALAKSAGEAVKPQSKKPAKSKPSTSDQSASTKPKPPEAEPEEKPMDDWWLVRDAQGRVGWVLARMIDVDIPLEIAQYAEGQRIQAAFILNTVQDDDKSVPQYVVVMNENHDGLPYDFNQVRVFTWNLHKHRYETGYREHFIIGFLPVTVGKQDFGKEGTEPVFTILKQNTDGRVTPRTYRLVTNVVRQVLAPGEKPEQAAHSEDAPKKPAAKPKRG